MDPLEPLSRVGAATAARAAAAPAGAASPAAAFIDTLASALQRVDASQAQAERLARAYQLGEEGVTLERSMVALQEANLSLQLAVQVRNKLVAAYHDVMNMPV